MLNDNKIRKLSNFAFYILPKLISLYLSNNNITQILQNTFCGFIFTLLYLSNNQIREISDYAFYDKRLFWWRFIFK